jgi:hypothetical protein
MEVQYLCELSKSLPCGLVAGKSLMLMAILVENPFRSPNGRSARRLAKNLMDPDTLGEVREQNVTVSRFDTLIDETARGKYRH